MHNFLRVSIGVAALCMAFSAMAQKPMTYPAKGQSAAQQGKDDGECYVWAKQNTGIDPAVVAQTPPPQDSGPAVGGGERVKGAALGALGGVAIGAIAGDAGKGAAYGAAVGVVAGRRRGKQAEQQAQQQVQQQEQGQSQATEAQMTAFRNAFSACLEGKQYIAKF